jgi:hypothetical protein
LSSVIVVILGSELRVATQPYSGSPRWPLWVRRREKGSKRHAMPCHHNLDEYLVAYLDGAGLRDDPKGPLFRTIGRGTGRLTRTVLPQRNAYAMIRRRAAAAGNRDQARQPQLPGEGDHRVPQERRYA